MVVVGGLGALAERGQGGDLLKFEIDSGEEKKENHRGFPQASPVYRRNLPRQLRTLCDSRPCSRSRSPRWALWSPAFQGQTLRSGEVGGRPDFTSGMTNQHEPWSCPL